ncbi:hypothetical protein BaRGS_00014606 [Batillaria attramentaria]|uniref:G-protein coupled receptors family 1 profile domain-containing protein n=1 Tax=Batillaria attramentaria TaxID=370345 RepID=A0ABD0L4J3_9CAEN
MLISIDRCFVLAFPVKARALAHVRRPRLYVLVIGICIFLMRLERLLKFRIAKVQGPFEQCTAGGAMVVPTNTYLRNMELFKYLSLANYILFSTIPVVISAASSVFLLVVLCKKSRSSATIKSNKSAHENDACTTELQPGDPQQPTRPELAAEVRLQHASQPTRPRTLSLQSGDVLRQETVGTRTPKRENPQDFDQQSLTPTKTLSLAELSTHASATLRGDSKRSSVPIAQSKPSANRNAFFRMRWQQSVSVLVYTILSTLLASPDLIMTVITFVIPEFQKYQSDPYLVRSLLSVFYILDTINSAMNFYVYFATGSTFRKELRNLLCEMVHCSKKWPQ